MRGASAAGLWRASAPFVAVMLLMLCVAVPSALVRASTLVYSDIDADTNWTKADGPYTVTKSISVRTGATLVIEAGTRVAFQKDAKLTVSGTLVAKNVTFTSDDIEPQAGDWAGILFFSAQGWNSSLDGSNIEYAQTAVHLMSTDMIFYELIITEFGSTGIMTSSGVTATIDSCAFMSSAGSFAINAGGATTIRSAIIDAGSGIRLGDGVQTVERNMITVRRTGIDVGSGSNSQIEENVINGRGVGDMGITLSDTSALATISTNDISGFDRGINLGAKVATTISENNIHSNRDFGIYSEYDVTANDCFFGRVPPLADDAPRPSDVTTKVTVANAKVMPMDLQGMAQPPGVVISSHKGDDVVKGAVKVTGKAFDPDTGEKITSVEWRVQVGTSGDNITMWSTAAGTADWSLDWDTSSLIAYRGYTVWVRAFSKDQDPGLNGVTLMVHPPDGGGGGGGGNDTNNTTDDGGKDSETLILGLPPLVFWSIVIVMMAVAVGAFVAVYVRSRKDEEVRRKALKELQAQWKAAVQQTPGPSVAMAAPAAAAPAAAAQGGGGMEDMIIEDVFLIYKDGRLLNHDGRRLRPEMDDDMLVGMFTAIQEFIKGAFPADSDDPTKNIVNEITRGDEKVLIEHGKFVYLAVVVQATDTKKVHARMKEVIAAIETEKRSVLEKWDGNMAVTGDLKPYTKRLIMGPF